MANALAPRATVPVDSSFPIGAARTSFVASVKSTASFAIAALHGPATGSAEARQEVLDKLQALQEGASRLRIERMVDALREAVGVLLRAPKYEPLQAAETERVVALLERLPRLAHTAGESAAVANPARLALLVGADGVERVLGIAVEENGPFECVHTAKIDEAIAQAVALSPDVVVIDADALDANAVLDGIAEAVPELLPMVVLGSFDAGDAAASGYLARGAVHVVSKPTAPKPFRALIDALFDGAAAPRLRGSLGTPTVGELQQLLGEELARALAPLGTSSELAVPLGEGTEVMAALWGAASRIREVITARTQGEVRFAAEGPAGAIALAPSLDLEEPGSARREPSRRRAQLPSSLAHTSILVVDDDPAVVWFLTDALRQAGASVHEAYDGEQALELAQQIVPDLIVSDILMPKMDGMVLSKRLRRDPLLRGTPVLLLSWKEDLLAKVRELGANAAGYLRKESDRSAVVFRAREVLAARSRLRARLGLANEKNEDVYGRLDGFSTFALLGMVSELRPNARLVVRDASAHYEVVFRDGSLHHAVKTSAGGQLVMGSDAMGALLGVTAARFHVSACSETLPKLFDRSLDQEAQHHALRVRALHGSLESLSLHAALPVALDPQSVAEYSLSMPQPVVEALLALSRGESVATACQGLDFEVWLKEALFDLAARGALRAHGEPLPVAVVPAVDDTAPAQPTVDLATTLPEEPSVAVRTAVATVAKVSPPLPAEPMLETPSPSVLLGGPAPAPRPDELTDIDTTLYGAEEAHVKTDVDQTLYGGTRETTLAALAAKTEQAKRAKLGLSTPPQSSTVDESQPAPAVDSGNAFADALSANHAPSPTPAGVVTEPVRHDSLGPQTSTPASLPRPARASRSLFPMALFGAATGGAILLATLLSPEGKGGAGAAGAPQSALGDTPAGIVEVEAGGRDVSVDGTVRGRGQRVSVVLPVGMHTVSVAGGQSREIDVKPSSVVRVNLATTERTP